MVTLVHRHEQAFVLLGSSGRFINTRLTERDTLDLMHSCLKSKCDVTDAGVDLTLLKSEDWRSASDTLLKCSVDRPRFCFLPPAADLRISMTFNVIRIPLVRNLSWGSDHMPLMEKGCRCEPIE